MKQREDEGLAEYKAKIADWIAYADKLEVALKLATGQTSDRLMRMHAEEGLRIVRPTDSESLA